MKNTKVLPIIAVSILISACGGGGGGESSPRSATEMPLFLQTESAKSRCSVDTNDGEIALNNYYGSLSDIEILNCYEVSLSSLDGIGNLVSLKKLSLIDVDISNFDSLTAFSSQLEYLDLGGNSIDDFSFLTSMTNLNYLDLFRTGLSDISWVSGLVQLKELNLSSNDVSDLLPLYSLELLETLNLSNNNNQKCSDVALLNAHIDANGGIIIPPSQCANVIFLNASSPETLVVDNSVESTGFDRVVLNDYSTDALTFVRTGNDMTLRLQVVDGFRSITFKSWFDGSQFRVHYFEFENGDEYSLSQIVRIVPRIEELSDDDNDWKGGEGTDVLTAGSGNDKLSGLGGDDSLNSGSGNDILVGGKGSDTLIGGSGDDMFAVNIAEIVEGQIVNLNGDSDSDLILMETVEGHDRIYQYAYDYPETEDTVQFGQAIKKDDLIWSHLGNDLVMSMEGDDNNSVTFVDWYLEGGYQNFYFKFYDDQEKIDAKAFINAKQIELIGTEQDDNINGSSGQDIIEGGAGNDAISGLKGNDIINGDIGDDVLFGNKGDDSLVGGPGNDVVIGGEDDDTLFGGPGDDIFVADVAEIVEGQIVNLKDDTDNDLILIEALEGHDRIYQYAYDYPETEDTVQFGQAIKKDDLIWSHLGNDLVMSMEGDDNNSVTFVDWYLEGGYQNFYFKFYDDQEKIDAKTFINAKQIELIGTEQDDNISGSSGQDIIEGGAGNDAISGLKGNDIINGDIGDDVLFGNKGDDSLVGGPGNDVVIGGEDDDTLFGGPGDDIFVADVAEIAEGQIVNLKDDTDNDLILIEVLEGHDRIYQYAYDYPKTEDTVQFGEAIEKDNLIWSQSGNDLVMSMEGDTSNSVTFVDWFLEGGYQNFYLKFHEDLAKVSAKAHIGSITIN